MAAKKSAAPAPPLKGKTKPPVKPTAKGMKPTKTK
jgi:hypothetical protein